MNTLASKNAMDVEKLLCESLIEPPCGPNLEFDIAFQELELAARGKPERAIGDKTVPAVPPDWAKVRELGEALLLRTKDVRVAVMLTRTLVHTDGVAGLSAGLELLRGLLERFWESVHPLLEGIERDPTMRMNAVAGLVDPLAMLPAVRDAIVADVPRKGRVTVRDVLVAGGRVAGSVSEPARPLPLLEGLVREAAQADRERIAAVQRSAHSVEGLQQTLLDKLDATAAAELAPLLELLKPVGQLCERVLNGSNVAPQEPGTSRSPVEIQAVPSPHATTVGPLRTRDDALRLLDTVCEFVERTEPANPAPLFIRRAQQLMSKNFIQIIEELAPESVSAIRTLAGMKSNG